ncbi:LysE family translocator [uncultured Kiloniella sp.]|uniref:LysE family translocator n=1 Tax=uncultured Kiloniella sp. TaxID=1133091 RepID=UPI00261E7897|nr:LysE family translocator [uncultured Kiloniella sp.]
MALPSLEYFLAYWLASTLLAATPGPTWLYTLTINISDGWKKSLWIPVGNGLGLLVHLLAALVGLSLLIQQSAVAYEILRWIGAGYLCFLAWKIFTGKADLEVNSQIPRKSTSALKVVIQSALINITNPKVIFFMISFLPQFVRPELGNFESQIMLYGLIHILNAGLIISLVVLFSEHMKSLFSGVGKTAKTFRLFASMSMVGIALRVAFSDK